MPPDRRRAAGGHQAPAHAASGDARRAHLPRCTPFLTAGWAAAPCDAAGAAGGAALGPAS
eukprot:10846073-Heterocapsa_arctica.AAC.1